MYYFAAKVMNYVTHCFSYEVLALQYSTQITFFILFSKKHCLSVQQQRGKPFLQEESFEY